jgi:hypothetical protein
MVATLAAGVARAPAQAAGLHFVVRGTVRHSQLGVAPRQSTYNFLARSDGCTWLISSKKLSDATFDEVTAIGNGERVFILMNMASQIARNRSRGQTVGLNESQAVVMPTPVPVLEAAPELGLIWLTYLSSCYFTNTGSNRIYAPIALNIAGGTVLPPAMVYYLGGVWQLDEHTMLPSALAGIDDGYAKGLLSGRLVNAYRYSPPYQDGFTNLLFKVTLCEQALGMRLPKKADLQVLWMRTGKPEPIHEMAIEADAFDAVPITPIPEPSPRGITIVTDARLSTSNGPVLLGYLATNEYLAAASLTNLPDFQAAVRRSLETPRMGVAPAASSSAGRTMIIAAFAVTSLGALVLIYGRRNNTPIPYINWHATYEKNRTR